MFVVQDYNEWQNTQPQKLKSQTWNGASLPVSMLLENVLPSCSGFSRFVITNTQPSRSNVSQVHHILDHKTNSLGY